MPRTRLLGPWAAWLAVIGVLSLTALVKAGCPGAPPGYTYTSLDFPRRSTAGASCTNSTSYVTSPQTVLREQAALCNQQATCNAFSVRTVDLYTYELCTYIALPPLLPYIGLAAKCDGTYSKDDSTPKRTHWDRTGGSRILTFSRSHTVMANDGQIVVWGTNSSGQATVPAALQKKRVAAVTAGYDTVYAITDTGELYSWGRALSNEPDAFYSNAIAIAAGVNHAVALLETGFLRAWGANSDGQTITPFPQSDDHPYVDIAAGRSHTLVITQSGQVFAWGSNSSGQSSVPRYLQDASVWVNRAVAIAAGDEHSLALLENGTVMAWGANNAGQVSVPSGIRAVSISAYGQASGAVLQDGTVVTWGNIKSPPAGLKGVVGVALGDYHVLALTTQGPQPPASSDKQPNDAAIIAGIAVGSVVVLAAICGTIAGVIMYRRRKARRLATAHDPLVYDDGSLIHKGSDTGPMTGPSGFVSLGAGAALGGNTKGGGLRTSDAEAAAQQSVFVDVSAVNAKVVAMGVRSASEGNTGASSSQTGLTHTEDTGGRSNDRIAQVEDGARGFVGTRDVHTVAERIMLHQTSTREWAAGGVNADSANHGISHDKSTSHANGAASGDSGANKGMSVSGQVHGMVPGQAPVHGSGQASGASAPTANRASGSSGVASGMSGLGQASMAPVAAVVASQSPMGLGTGPSQVLSPTGAVSHMDDDTAYQRGLLARLRIPWESIQMGRVLGEGGFGTVYRGTWQDNAVAVKTLPVTPVKAVKTHLYACTWLQGNAVAVKTLNKQHFTEATQDALRREALAMFARPHPCIAHVYGLVDDGEHCALVMKYYRRGTLSAAINDMTYCNLNLGQRLKIAQQVASGMCSLHDRNMLHGDLKTANLLIEDDGAGVVISDFGLSGVAGQAVASGALTLTISPPEVLANPQAPRTQAGDVYAFAIVLLEILSGRPAYTSITRDMLRRNVLEGRRPPIPGSLPDDVSHIITQCWAQDPAQRPTFNQLVGWLTECVARCGVQQGEELDKTVTAVVGFEGMRGGRGWAWDRSAQQDGVTQSYQPTHG